MAFTDLPDDLRDRPLTDPVLVADVLDLVVLDVDRHRGALAVLLCDDEGRLLVPVVVGGVPERLSEHDRTLLLTRVLEGTGGAGSVLVAVARRDGLGVRPGDEAWARTAARVLADGPRCSGSTS